MRAHAARLGLATAEKPDSQDICFVPAGSYADIVSRLRPDAAEPGDIVSRSGQILGAHAGIAHYTVGQAKRLGNASQHAGQPMVVLALDAATRRVIVGPRGTGTSRLALRDVNWLVPPPFEPLACHVKLRARDGLRAAMVEATPEGAQVILQQDALPAPGQACVFYDGTRVLGGGFIRREDLARAA